MSFAEYSLAAVCIIMTLMHVFLDDQIGFNRCSSETVQYINPISDANRPFEACCHN